MKRSRVVQAFLVVSAASTLSSCGQKHEASRRCVDENGLFTEDRNCGTSGGGAGVASGGHHYVWVYAPAGATNKTDEGRTEGRSGATTGAADTARSDASSRGVIGGEGAAHASAGGEAGGGHAGGGE